MRKIFMQVAILPVLLLAAYWSQQGTDPLPIEEVQILLQREMPRVFNVPRVDFISVNADSLFPRDGSLDFKLPGDDAFELAMLLTPSTVDEVYGMQKIIHQLNQSRTSNKVGLRLLSASPRTIKGLQLDRSLLQAVSFCPYLKTGCSLWLRDYLLPTSDGKNNQLFIEMHGNPKESHTAKRLARILGFQSLKPKNIDFGHSGNAGGNILITPDNVAIVGSTMSRAMRSYLRALPKVKKTVVVDTDWYYFGHLGTTVALLPTPNAPKSYILAVADARLGKELLENINGNSIKNQLKASLERLFVYRKFYPTAFDKEEAVLGMKIFDELAMAYRHLKGFDNSKGKSVINASNKAGNALDTIVTKLAAELHVPTVRLPALYSDAPYGLVADLTPALANMIVLGEDLILPDCLLPAFTDHTVKVLATFGFRVHYLPSATYHNMRGQIKLATVSIPFHKDK